MTNPMRTTIWVIAILVASWASAPAAAAQAAAIAVVVSEKSPISNLSHAELRKIFAGEKKKWSDGSSVKVFVRGPGTPERAAVLDLLGMSEADYKKHWTTMIFRGEVQDEPVALPSNGMQREAILAFPGGIALVSVNDVKQGMKVITIDGHSPHDSDYAIH
jgi:PBP superfamily domain